MYPAQHSSARERMAEKWILRIGSKSGGFSYSGPDGERVRARKELERIALLRVPPAWANVHIAASPRAAIQVWGHDARGRKQYRYHTRAVQQGELRKHYRVRQMAKDLPRMKRKIKEDFQRHDFSKHRVCAGIVLLISDSFFRVGSDRYERENKTFGLTTFRKSHVVINGDEVRFTYIGKRSIKQWTMVDDAPFARFIELLLLTPGNRLFRYERDGDWFDVDADDVNDYIERVAGFPYTAKDLRTWGGTLRAATILEDLGHAKSKTERNKNVIAMVRMVASELGNTPAIARKSYVHPVVITRYLKNGSTIVLPRRRSSASPSPFRQSVEEAALIRFLDEHFPDRRRQRREK